MNNSKAILVENNDVQKKIEQVSKKLKKRYSYKKKEINESKFKRSKTQKVLSVIYDIFTVLFTLICTLVCFSVIYSKMQNTPPCLIGTSVVRISSPSMTASGFEVGDYISLKKVNTKTLTVGDEIAFYTYYPSYNSFNINNCTLIDPKNIAEHDYDLNFTSFIGIQTPEIREAGKAGAQIVFHEITMVLEDDNGNRWFKTKGTSNSVEDNWFIADNMVVGVYQEGAFGNFIAKIIGEFSSSSILLFLAIALPIGLIIFSIMKDYVRELSIAIIENEIVRGKRKLNDRFCVENKIGPNLSKKEKLKVLAQAKEKEKLEYINLLWPNKKPESIRKHYLKKRLKLREYEEKFKLHKACERKMKQGTNITKIATYYTKEKTKIEQEQEKINKRLKSLSKNLK